MRVFVYVNAHLGGIPREAGGPCRFRGLGDRDPSGSTLPNQGRITTRSRRGTGGTGSAGRFRRSGIPGPPGLRRVGTRCRLSVRFSSGRSRFTRDPDQLQEGFVHRILVWKHLCDFRGQSHYVMTTLIRLVVFPTGAYAQVGFGVFVSHLVFSFPLHTSPFPDASSSSC